MKAISDAHTCKDRRTYVQGRLQVRAGKVASISVEDAVHSIFFPQTFATAIVNVCGEKTRLLWNPFPHVFLLSTRLGFSPNVGWPYHMVLSLRKGNASPEREELYSRLAKLWGTFPID